MKNSIVILMAGILLLLSAHAPAQWVAQQSNLPANKTIYRISIVNENVVWAGGSEVNKPSSYFIRTVDGGEHWIVGTIPLPADFFICNISACSADTAWAAACANALSDKAGVYKTTDGGKTWKQQLIAPSFIDFVYFFNSREGLAFCDPSSAGSVCNAIYTTSDGGASWTAVPSAKTIPLSNEAVIYSSHSVCGNDLYTATTGGRILKTRDKGKSWSVIYTGFDSYLWPSFKDPLNGLVAAANMSVHYGMALTANGGWSWTPVPNVDLPSYYPVSIPETAGGYVVSAPTWGLGKKGSAFTIDNGSNWTMIDDIPHLWTEFFSQDLGWGGDGSSNKIYKWSISRQAAIGSYPLTALHYGVTITGSSSEAKSVSITNYGKEALTISEIIKPGVDFTLANLPALPLTLATFQSINLDVCFTPQKGGLSADSIVIVSNANNSPRYGIKLEGTGAQINRVQPDILYAVSASSLYTIDPSTGKATLVGPLSMTQVQGLALNPLTLELIGITATTSDMTCYRIDSQSGSSFLLQKISLGSSRAIAFKGDTLFAGSNSGKLYRLNLGANSVSQIGSVANINYYGLVVHPGTGQLYAAAQSTSSAIKDKIFIINTTNGDTVSVGATGDNSITQAIAFSPSGILYGLKTGWTGNTLVTIDAKTGAATLVGSTGVSGLRGLVIGPGTTAVKEQAKHDITPQQFVLSQNYPNPFNPSTTIEFSLQASEQVSLKVYSILGHELAELIHGTLPAGVHKAVWDAKDCANGIYYIVLEADGCREVRKAILMK